MPKLFPSFLSYRDNQILKCCWSPYYQETSGKQYWSMFHFKFLSVSDNLIPAYLYITRVRIEWRVVPIIETGEDETDVVVTIRTNVQTEDTEKRGPFKTNVYRWSEFTINRSSCNFVDTLMLVDVRYQIRIKQVNFYSTQQSSPLIYQYGGYEQEGNHIVELSVTRSSSNQMFVVAPVGDGNSFSTLTFRGRVIWNDQPVRQFNAEYASGQKMASRQFDKTVVFSQLRTPNRQRDTLWQAHFETAQFQALAFYFPSKSKEFKISAIVASDNDIGEITEERPNTSTEKDDLTPVSPTEPCYSFDCMPSSKQTAAGVVVGIIGALVVVSLVAAVLIWKKRSGRGGPYTSGTIQGGGIYPDRATIMGDLDIGLRENGVHPRGVSLPVSF